MLGAVGWTSSSAGGRERNSLSPEEDCILPPIATPAKTGWKGPRTENVPECRRSRDRNCQ